MTKLKQIEEFLAAETVAMAGVSRNPKKFGFMAFRELREKGMNVIPVNPNAGEIHQVKTYPDIMSLPPEVKNVIIMTRKDKCAGLVREAKAKGLKHIWLQQSSESSDALKELEGTDINYISGQCILMYYKPHGVHKFHLALKKLFGRYPK